MLAISPDERLTAARRAKLAYIYVRQSSVTQVKHHQESTELQYRLVDRAIGLGWPRPYDCFSGRWPVIRYATVRGLSRLAGTEPHA
jgi:hypothetical protein